MRATCREDRPIAGAHSSLVRRWCRWQAEPQPELRITEEARDHRRGARVPARDDAPCAAAALRPGQPAARRPRRAVAARRAGGHRARRHGRGDRLRHRERAAAGRAGRPRRDGDRPRPGPRRARARRAQAAPRRADRAARPRLRRPPALRRRERRPGALGVHAPPPAARPAAGGAAGGAPRARPGRPAAPDRLRRGAARRRGRCACCTAGTPALTPTSTRSPTAARRR